MSDTPLVCLPYETELSALLDGELESPREAEVRRHVDSCARCRLSLEQLRGVDVALVGAALPSVPQELGDRIRSRIDRGDPDEIAVVSPAQLRRRQLRRRVVGSALAVAASVSVYLGVFQPAFQNQGSETPTLGAGGSARIDADLEATTDEELAIVLQLETIQDLDVIANLEVLERLLALEFVATDGGSS